MATQLSDKVPQKEQQINWNQFNYPPLLKLMHFRPSEIPQGKKRLVMMAFAIHLTVVINSILNIIDNITIGGISTIYIIKIDILYSFLFFFIFNPIVLFLFYRCHIGLCKEKSKLSLYTYIQPLVIIIEILISILDFISFNGFVKVSHLYNEGYGFQATLALIVSIVYLVVAVVSSYLYFLMWKKRSFLAKALI